MRFDYRRFNHRFDRTALAAMSGFYRGGFAWYWNWFRGARRIRVTFSAQSKKSPLSAVGCDGESLVDAAKRYPVSEFARDMERATDADYST